MHCRLRCLRRWWWRCCGQRRRRTGTTRAWDFFNRERPSRAAQAVSLLHAQACSGSQEHGEVSSKVSVVACGVNDPLNVGSMLRLMACFGAARELVVVYYGKGGKCEGNPDPQRRISTDSPGFFQQPEIARKIATTAKGAMDLTGPVTPIDLEAFLAENETSPLPLVVLETAPGAVSIREFTFPANCCVVVGSEVRGVSPKLLSSLKPARGDTAVYVPMPGPYPSLNAGMALACALFEYRRQWPGGSGVDTVKA
eukprot:TRINITY_DN48620_c0_g1_i1.p1 TRINITY_DN48620_c0_g1~~TRINITY_DN48620_c0_g1_i1.p1  ORF type:complete len:254 (-),score=33.57 TRINITY_DN48620_c0_g1_i1:61-822(-)